MAKPALNYLPTMTFRIRLVTRTDKGGLSLRDVSISNAWQQIDLPAIDAFHLHLCDLLATEGVCLDALHRCTALSLWYVSDTTDTFHSLSDPHCVPPNSLVFFDTCSASITQTYALPKEISAHDLASIEKQLVLTTHCPSEMTVCLDGNLEVKLPFPITMDSCKLIPWVLSTLTMSGIFVHYPRAYVTHPAWGGKLIEFTGRHQMQSNNKLRIAGAVEMASKILSIP